MRYWIMPMGQQIDLSCLKIQKPAPKMLEMAKVLHLASQGINIIVTMLRKFKNAQTMIEHSARIKLFRT